MISKSHVASKHSPLLRLFLQLTVVKTKDILLTLSKGLMNAWFPSKVHFQQRSSHIDTILVLQKKS